MAKTKTKRNGLIKNRYLLYERAVQSVDADLDFAVRVFKKRHGRNFTSLREDFCGTAALASTWVARGKDHVAIGVDLDRTTLAEARRRNVARLGAAAKRLTLLRADVRSVTRPKVDVAVAFNFSYWIFKERADLLAYFTAVRKSLRPGGQFLLDVFGGTEAFVEAKDTRAIPAGETPDGTKVHRFRYVWDQARFNPITHDFQCHIHFVLPDGTRLRKAFSYDWRFWTLPELRDVLAEAGFASQDVYTDGWDDKEDDADGIYRKRLIFDNEGCWIGYLVAEV